jgi:hypothetical protein
VGRHPDERESETYGISRELPVFMSVRGDQDVSEAYKKYLRKTNEYFLQHYSSK